MLANSFKLLAAQLQYAACLSPLTPCIFECVVYSQNWKQIYLCQALINTCELHPSKLWRQEIQDGFHLITLWKNSRSCFYFQILSSKILILKLNSRARMLKTNALIVNLKGISKFSLDDTIHQWPTGHKTTENIHTPVSQFALHPSLEIPT